MATTEHSDLEQQIIKTAQQLFIEKGFVETSMSDIAATVGINRPTLHYYFRTKDKMFKAVFGSIVMSLMPLYFCLMPFVSGKQDCSSIFVQYYHLGGSRAYI